MGGLAAVAGGRAWPLSWGWPEPVPSPKPGGLILVKAAWSALILTREKERVALGHC